MLVGAVNGDERYVSIVEPNLYSNAIFQPGVTYTDKYEVADAYSAKVAKVGVGTLGDPTTGVSDYSHENASDELITIPYNNCFQDSKKMYNIQAQSVAYDLGAENIAVVVNKTRVRKDRAGVACLVKESTAYTDTTETTVANCKATVLAVKKQMLDKDANPNVAICSNEFYNTVLTTAGAEFDNDVKNMVMTEGQIGRWMGITWIPTSILALASAKYYDNAGTLQTVDLLKTATNIADGSAIEFIMYDYDAFSILGNMTDLGLYDGHPAFNGTAAQDELYAGFKVTNSVRAVCKSKVLEQLT